MKNALKMVLVAAVAVLFAGAPSWAEVELAPEDGFLDSLTFSGEVTLFSRYTENPLFGGEDNPSTGYGYTPDKVYGEVYTTLGLTGEKRTAAGVFSAQVAPYYIQTMGQDFFGFMDHGTSNYYEWAGYDGNVDNYGLDQAWVKWGDILNSNMDLTVGRQNIQLEKQFIMGIAREPAAGVWICNPKSFSFGLRLDGDWGPVNGTLFWARSDKYRDALEDDVKTYGLNLHYDFSETAFIYGGVFVKDEPAVGSGSSTLLDGAENDTTTYDLGGEISFGPLQLEGELALQTGDVKDNSGKDYDRESMAYWASATYWFPVKWNPYFKVMQLNFSGDGNDGDAEVNGYDSMFSGASSWNHFFVGEMVGEAHLVNTNKRNLILEAGFSPVETLAVSLMYIQHTLNDNGAGPDDWGDEVNLFFDWFATDNIFVHWGVGMAMPGDAAIAKYGNDKDAVFGQCQVSYYF
ncbi:MAG: alginate export family protein [Desulfobacterales bacterium]|nr:alginate export family protein [Desulfobacterales bacterium]